MEKESGVMKGPGLDVLEVAEGNVPGMAEAENLLTIGLTSTRPGCQSVKLITAVLIWRNWPFSMKKVKQRSS